MYIHFLALYMEKVPPPLPATGLGYYYLPMHNIIIIYRCLFFNNTIFLILNRICNETLSVILTIDLFEHIL